MTCCPLSSIAGHPGAGCGNRSLIMRSCRDDGVLLRADKPATMMDAAFTALQFEGGTGAELAAINVWSTHSDIRRASGESSAVRFGYVLGLDLLRPFNITTADILPARNSAPSWSGAYRVWKFWRGLSAGQDTTTRLCDGTTPFELPAPPRSGNAAVITSSFHVLAPVLRNGWAYLGEPGKLVSASARRVRTIDDRAADRLTVCLLGSPG